MSTIVLTNFKGNTCARVTGLVKLRQKNDHRILLGKNLIDNRLKYWRMTFDLTKFFLPWNSVLYVVVRIFIVGICIPSDNKIVWSMYAQVFSCTCLLLGLAFTGNAFSNTRAAPIPDFTYASNTKYYCVMYSQIQVLIPIHGNTT